MASPWRENAAEGASPEAGQLRTLVLTDLVASTRLVGRLGDQRAAELFHRHDRLARDLLADHRGREIDKTDGFLLLFDRPADALAYGLAYHHALRMLSQEASQQLRARVGIHLGEVVLRSNSAADIARGAKPLEVEGLAKPTCARLTALARPQQTLLTEGAFNLARESASDLGSELRWLAHGPYLFQGVEDPVPVFEVGEVGLAPLAAPPDGAKARRAVAAGEELTLGWRPAPGQEIPRRPNWFLERRLGEGGFGEVWLGRQETTDALRVFKFCYEAERLRALQREVTVFRLLKETLGDRDDIARILDWNFEEAPYFLESEYSDDGDMIEWSEAQGGLSAIPLEQRLEILAQVADALGAAHSVGVLHKDIKPGNVLIAGGPTGAPRARLTDFGIGLVTDQRLLLARGITVFALTELSPDAAASRSTGTRIYLAPELLEGKAPSVQADIFALGVMAYQTVVGDFSRALAPGWQRDLSDPLLAQDLASFVDRDPARRPGNAAEVATRLRTLEQRRATQAEEAAAQEQRENDRRALERAQKRRRWAAGIAAVAVAFLAVVSVLAIKAQQARREADSRRQQAEGLLSYLVGDLPAKVAPLGRLDILDDLGDRALAYFASVPEETLTPEEVARHAEALHQIGSVHLQQGNLPGAVPAFAQSLQLAKALAARDPANGGWQKKLGESHYWVGYALWQQGDLDRAFGHFEEYLTVAHGLVAAEPANPEWRLELAYAHSNLGSVEKARGRLDPALAAFRRTLTIEEALLAEEPGNHDYRIEVAATLNNIGAVLWEQGELNEARRHFVREQSLKAELVRERPDHAQWRRALAVSHNYVGALEQALGESSAAGNQFSAAVAIMDDLTERDPTNIAWHRDLAKNLGRRGQLAYARGDIAAARGLGERVLRLMTEAVAKDPTITEWRHDLADAHADLAQVELAAGHLGPADRHVLLGLEALGEEPMPQVRNRDRRRREGYLYLAAGLVAERRGEPGRARALWLRGEEALRSLASGSRDPHVLDPWVRCLVVLEDPQAQAAARELAATGYRDPVFLAWARRNERPSSNAFILDTFPSS